MISRASLSQEQMMELLSASAMDRKAEQQRTAEELRNALGSILYERLLPKGPLLLGFGFRIVDSPADFTALLCILLLESIGSARATLEVREIREAAEGARLRLEEDAFHRLGVVLRLAGRENEKLLTILNEELFARRKEEQRE